MHREQKNPETSRMRQKRTKQSYAELEVNEAYVYLNSPPASEVAEVKPVMKSSALNGEIVRVSILRAILSRDDQTKKPTNEQKKTTLCQEDDASKGG